MAELEKANDKLEKAYNMTVKEVLGFKQKKVKPWISKKTWDLIEQRKAIKLKLDGTNSERQRSRSEEANTQGQEELVRWNSKGGRGSSQYQAHEDSLEFKQNALQ